MKIQNIFKKFIAVLLAFAMLFGHVGMVGGFVNPTVVNRNGNRMFNSASTIAELGLTGAGDTPIDTWTDGFFTVSGGQWRPGQGGGVFETARNGVGAVAFTTDGTSNITIVASSTGGANTSAIALWNANDEPIIEIDGTTTVFGTNPQTTLTFENVPAGTYRIVSNDIQEGNGHNRGVRIFNVSVAQTESTPIDPADSPTNLTATGGEDAQVTLSWTPVANATRHEVRHRTVGSSDWSLWTTTTLRNSHIVTGLINGATYEFQVRGHDGMNASAESAIVVATPTALPILALNGVNVGETQLWHSAAQLYSI